MKTITIYKLLSYDDTMTLIRNACVGLDITLNEYDVEGIKLCVSDFFDRIEKYDGTGLLLIRLKASFQGGHGADVYTTCNSQPANYYATTNYNKNKLDDYVFCMKRCQGSYEEFITRVECCQEYPVF